MTSIFGGRKRRISNSERLDIRDFLQSFLEELLSLPKLKSELKGYRIRSEEEAERIKGLINSRGQYFKTVEMIQGEKDDCQEVEYRPSHLGHGFIFLFVCVGCGRTVRHLYRVSTIIRYRCRICLNLSYYRPAVEKYQKPEPIKAILQRYPRGATDTKKPDF